MGDVRKAVEMFVENLHAEVLDANLGAGTYERCREIGRELFANMPEKNKRRIWRRRAINDGIRDFVGGYDTQKWRDFWDDWEFRRPSIVARNRKLAELIIEDDADKEPTR